MSHLTQLIDARSIHNRVGELAAQVTEAFGGQEVTVCAVMTGSLFFAADLVRRMDCATRIVTIEASSYRGGTTPGELSVYGLVEHKVRDHHVLLVDDIFDTGRTMNEIARRIEALSPKDLKRCVLLNKLRPGDRGPLPEFVGFDIPDAFVVGYGLDMDGLHRNLPYIARVDPRVL